VKDGYCKIANELMGALGRIRIPGEANQILNVIIRQTYGWNKKKDQISLSQFVEKTGIKKPNVRRAIKTLQGMNLIIVGRIALSKKIMSVIEKDNADIPSYGINKDYETWKPLSKKITVIEKDNRSLSKKIPTKDTITKDKVLLAESQKKLTLSSEPSMIPVFIKIPLNDGTNFKVTEDLIKEWESLYSALDIKQRLRDIRGWNLANKQNRKTKRGVLRHINTWLAREQDKAQKVGSSGTATDMRQCKNPKKPQCGALFDFKTDRNCPKCGWEPQ